MKRIVLLLSALMLAGIGASAQSVKSFEKGYRGNVSLGSNIGVTKGVMNSSVGLTTSHGYSWGNGMYLGAGTGVGYMFSGDVLIPVFMDAKYNIIDWKLSPFADCRIGGEGIVCDGDTGMALLVSPGIGVDFSRFTFRVGYLCEAGRYNADVYMNGRYSTVTSYFKYHSMTVSFACNF